MNQSTIGELRKTQDSQVERLRKLQADKRLATPQEQENIEKDIELAGQEIRNLDTLIQGLLQRKTAKP